MKKFGVAYKNGEVVAAFCLYEDSFEEAKKFCSEVLKASLMEISKSKYVEVFKANKWDDIFKI
ncbi:hypothetical protein P9D54_13195 [Bacillus haynesii]|uniref:hypothetical protein n=1 Tax=Bacillus TaxID=1386 RepID=UPI0005CF50A7|nr:MULTISPECIES: hypothetical protein [Bacillus]MCY8009717.1 hypothetical protein [Bacillus haynesii]MCY8567416.1 hypothetical protein [Bacillus haynesii]MCY8663692.1 hypothetical protein [Bacillus haynesii]MEC1346320.1 hypothetical protein [Bacillus haynesii]PAE70578.1 hypothetical protein CHH84_19850 [Bacillus licheniformis]